MNYFIKMSLFATISFAVAITAFTILAIHFDHWWIGLFGLLLMPSLKFERRKGGVNK